MCGPAIAAGATKLFAGIQAATSAAGGLSTVLTGAAGAISTLGYLQQAKVAQSTAKRNAAIQEQAAMEALDAGQEASDRRRRQGAAAASMQRAQMAANGVDVNGPDALGLLDETRQFTAEDAFSIRENARRDARGQLQGAANSITQGRVDASNARFGAARTILGTGARVGEKYRHWAVEQAGAY